MVMTKYQMDDYDSDNANQKSRQKMGCVTGSKPMQQTTVNISRYSEYELELIKMMYDNLATRCKGKLLTREVFELFFHVSGLFGEIMFTKFDVKKNGTINFQQFIKAIEVMVKGTFKEKANVLFAFYDIDNTQGINSDELLKMLFSYSNEDLNKMFTEPKFLDFLGEGQMGYFFGPEHKIQEKNIVEQVSQDKEQDFPIRKASVYAPNSSELIEIQQKIRLAVQQHSKTKKKQLPPIFRKSQLPVRGMAPMRQMSNPDINLSRSRNNLQLKSNISSLVKKYATFLFQQQKLDLKKDKFSKQHFFSLLQNHPSIFNVYFSGFHTYIWLVNNGLPQFMQITPWVQNECEQHYKDDKQGRYLKFIRSTVFVFTHQRAKKPLEVINLQGLTIEAIIKEDLYGIVFKHRDGLYPKKEYYFKSKMIHEEWLKHLADFKENSIYDSYIIQEKIGGGNFSTVFRGKDKKTGKEVAIKVIENFKLSLNEKEVLQRESGILKLCHHPNIIKFLHQYKTKTHLYIVMELLTEGDLFEYTKKNTFLEQYQAAVIFKQLVEAIMHLNELGVIHRDLKPENVMIVMTEDRKMCKRAKLIDFGFGVYKDQLKDLSAKLKFAGTPGFIAPEVLNGQEYDESVDTFSLGIILYFMLCGFLPFHSNFYEEIVEMTKSCSVSLTNLHWSNVSDSAKDLIYKVLTFKEERITTKQVHDHEWLQDIDKLKAYEGRNKKLRYI